MQYAGCFVLRTTNSALFHQQNIILFFIIRSRISSFNLHIPPYEALFESNVRHVYSANADSTHAKGANE